MDQSLPVEVCKICNTADSKYTCPRCGCRTCSVQCVKRHKQWSQCSGKRNRAKFVRKSALDTSAGIDHDFNFLTAVERSLDVASTITKPKSLEEASGRRLAVSRVNLDDRTRKAGVNVVHAPKGMHRRESNRTTWQRWQNALSWTVEWLFGKDGQMLTQTLETLPLHEEFERICSNDRNDADRSNISFPSKRRRLSHTETAKPVSGYDNVNTGYEFRHPSHPTRYIYILKPFTRGPVKVVTPLKPSDTLASCLRGQTVAEFPTLLVLAHPATALPEGVVLDRVYLQDQRWQRQDVDRTLAKLLPHIRPPSPDTSGTVIDTDNDLSEADRRKLLDSLQKDIDIVLK